MFLVIPAMHFEIGFIYEVSNKAQMPNKGRFRIINHNSIYIIDCILAVHLIYGQFYIFVSGSFQIILLCMEGLMFAVFSNP